MRCRGRACRRAFWRSDEAAGSQSQPGPHAKNERATRTPSSTCLNPPALVPLMMRTACAGAGLSRVHGVFGREMLDRRATVFSLALPAAIMATVFPLALPARADASTVASATDRRAALLLRTTPLDRSTTRASIGAGWI
jgi:hypothetical protein